MAVLPADAEADADLALDHLEDLTLPGGRADGLRLDDDPVSDLRVHLHLPSDAHQYLAPGSARRTSPGRPYRARAFATAAATSSVDEVPPRSAVRTSPSARTRSTADSTMVARSRSPR